MIRKRYELTYTQMRLDSQTDNRPILATDQKESKRIISTPLGFCQLLKFYRYLLNTPLRRFIQLQTNNCNMIIPFFHMALIPHVLFSSRGEGTRETTHGTSQCLLFSSLFPFSENPGKLVPQCLSANQMIIH